MSQIMDFFKFSPKLFFLFNLTLFPNFEAKPTAKDQKTENVFPKSVLGLFIFSKKAKIIVPLCLMSI